MHKLATVLAILAVFAPAQTPQVNHINEGVRAFKAAKYAEAVTFFEQAVQIAPGDAVAHLYLGSGHMSQFVPGVITEANTSHADIAEREFQAVLAIQPDNRVALESIASLNFNRAQSQTSLVDRLRYLDDAARWYDKLSIAYPDSKTAHYNLGVIAWSKFYPALMDARSRLGMKPETPGPLPDAGARSQLNSQYGRLVEDGMRHLEKALVLDPEHSDAMAYLNLLYRERADLYDSQAEYQREVMVADNWVQKALEAKKRAAERPGQQAATLQFAREQFSSQPAPQPGAFGGFLLGTPPTPPPPPPAAPWQAAGGAPIEVPKQIRVGGNVQAAKLTEKPDAVYPPLAMQARIQGVVRFNAVIGKDGTVQNLTLVSGHPLLVPSATEAVRRYCWQPTLLNGEPVEVVTQVDVPFTL